MFMLVIESCLCHWRDWEASNPTRVSCNASVQLMQVTSCKTVESCHRSRASLISLHKRSFLQYHEVLDCYSMPPFLQKCVAQKAKETAPALMKDSVAGLAAFCLTVLNGVAEVNAACCQVLVCLSSLCKSQQRSTFLFLSVQISCQ